jgi:hypothetical protein
MTITQYDRSSTSLQRAANTNVGFVNLLKRHDKPWMDGRVRRVNLQLHQAMMECDMADTAISDTASLVAMTT